VRGCGLQFTLGLLFPRGMIVHVRTSRKDGEKAV
jgi:hypothetical protein